MSNSRTIDGDIEMRKKEHIDICLNKQVETTSVTTLFEEYFFVHQALPEIDFNEIDMSIALLGKKINFPLLISSMVGGTEMAYNINRNLAIVARDLGIAMAVGSQRCAIEKHEFKFTYDVREFAPDIPLYANLGAVQLNNSYGIYECQKAVEMINADALILHLNPLQEAMQVNGDKNFKGLLNKIHLICNKIEVPVIVKEVGCGISKDVAKKLHEAGVSAIDVAGAGGTSWSEVEKFRCVNSLNYNTATAFSSWGIPTSQSIYMSKQGAPGLPLIASGGIRSGVDVAVAIALGADLAGMALPFLKFATESAESLKKIIMEIIEGLKVAMFCTGISSINELKNTKLLKRRGTPHE